MPAFERARKVHSLDCAAAAIRIQMKTSDHSPCIRVEFRIKQWALDSVVVNVLCCKPEGRGFETR
jgi:hypothetical protein